MRAQQLLSGHGAPDAVAFYGKRYSATCLSKKKGLPG